MGLFGNVNMGGGGDGPQGPWVDWKPEGDAEWNIPFKSFCIRGADPQTPKELRPIEGRMVLDIAHIRIGWRKFPSYHWLPKGVYAVGQRPTDERDENGRFAWQPAFCAPVLCKTLDGRAFKANWSQSQASANTGLQRMMEMLEGVYRPEFKDQLPVLALSGTDVIQTKNKPIIAPLFSVEQWIQRPADLPDQDPLGSAGSSAAPQAAAPAASPQPPAQPQAPLSQRAMAHAPQQRPSGAALAAANTLQAPPEPPAPSMADLEDEIPF